MHWDESRKRYAYLINEIVRKQEVGTRAIYKLVYGIVRSKDGFK